ncbi:MAG: hydroxymethylglutaryl-CoA lyase [Bacteroidales bacterium]
MMNEAIRITESPRDAMQGLANFIPTEDKIRYINALLRVGFDVIDFGSFVSPKAIPQMADTEQVLAGLNHEQSRSKLLVIVPNVKGAQMAARHPAISFQGFPFSVSPTFLERNIRSSVEKAWQTVLDIAGICAKSGQEPVIYISMAFGNPYGDEWHPELVAHWVDRLVSAGVKRIKLSDTVGISSRKNIARLFQLLVPAYPDVCFGLHLHTTIRHWYKKINAAWQNGCRSFDTVINGLGGCPMAENRLVGNLRTSNLLEFCEVNNIPVNIDDEAFEEAYRLALEIFPS